MYTEEALHPHVYPPYVLVHLHSRQRHTVEPAHSSMSLQLKPSPVNPAGHLHPVPGSMSCRGGDTDAVTGMVTVMDTVTITG